MKYGLAGILMLFSVAAGAADIDLLLPVSGGRFAESAPGHYPVKVNLEALKLSPGEEVKLTLSGVTHMVVYERSARHDNGDVTWVGYLKEKGNDYRVIITRGKAGSFGRILSPDGEFALEPADGGEKLIDRKRAGHEVLPMGDDIYIPDDVPFSPAQPEAARQNAFADASTNVDIDLLIVYTPGMVKNYPGDALQTRLNYLVALANQAYIDSKVGINLRLMRSERVEYSDTTINNDALNALIQGGDPALSGVAALRVQYGADLVALIRPRVTADVNCGLGVLVGANGNDVSQYASKAFSVVSDGAGCPDYALAHELGHNMGSQHDRANVDNFDGKHTGNFTSGAYPYSYGYGKEGTFGTIMSYINPRVGKFSNPAITCNGEPCGISETAPDAANNTLSLNNTRFAVANFKPSSGKSPEYAYTLIAGFTATESGGVVTLDASNSYSRNGDAITGYQWKTSDGQTATGKTVTLRFTGSGTTYRITLVVSDGKGGTGEVTQSVYVQSGYNEPPIASFTATPDSGILPLTVSLDASASYDPDKSTGGIFGLGSNLIHEWKSSDGQASDRLVSPMYSFRYATAGVYEITLVVTDPRGAKSTPIKHTIKVNAATVLSGVKPMVSAGSSSSLFLKSDGSVWLAGYSKVARSSTTVPTEVLGLRAQAVATGEDHWLALKADGSVWAWGTSADGQLGTGATTYKDQWGNQFDPVDPVVVPGLSGITAIAAGGTTSLALKSDGTVWRWGAGTRSPTLVDGLNNVAAIITNGGLIVALMRDGTVWTWSSGTAAQMPGISDATAIAAEMYYTLALKRDGTVWRWENSKRSPALVGGLNNVMAISAGRFQSLALRSDGTVWIWGRDSGQVFGVPTTLSGDIPTPQQVPGISSVAAIAAAEFMNNFALLTDGSVYGWGAGQYGMLGNSGKVSCGVWDCLTKTPTIVTLAGGVPLKLGTIAAATATTGQTNTVRADCLFSWAEKTYPDVLAPTGATTQTTAPYTYRYYSGTKAYLGTSSADNHLYYLGPLSKGAILDLSGADGWMQKAGCQ